MSKSSAHANKEQKPLDINHVIQDIFADKNTFDSKFLKYERLKEEYENEEKNHIYNHYKTFIKITDELKNVQNSVVQMKNFFFEYEALLNSLKMTLKDEEIAKKAQKRKNTINRQIFDFSINDEEDDLDSNEVIEDIKKASNEKKSLNARSAYDLTDQVNEIVDKFDLAIYEKNYNECIKIYRLFRAMKTSKKYSDAIMNYEIRKNIDFHYTRLSESLLSDIFNDTTKNLNDIIKYLIEIGQLHKAKIAVLSLKSKELEKKLRSFAEENRYHDETFFEQIAKEFFDGIIGCFKFIQTTFKDPNQTSSSSSSFSTWVMSELQNFYSIIGPFLFESDDIEIAMEYLKKVCMIFMEKQSEGLSLSIEFQKIALNDFQELLDEVYKTIEFNFRTSVAGEDYNLYSFFPIFNVLEYNIEIIETTSLIDISKKYDPRRSNQQRNSSISLESEIKFAGEKDQFPEEFNQSFIDSKISEILLMTDFSLKFTRSMNYFWNAVFFLIDLSFSVKDVDTIPVLSSHFFSLIQFKLEALFENLFKIYFEILDEKVSKTESQTLAYLTSLFYSKTLAENLDKILYFKFAKMYKKNQSFQIAIGNFTKNFEEAIALHSKINILDKVAPSIVKNINIYTKKEAKIVVEKPTNSFIELAQALEQTNENITFLLGTKNKERVLYHIFYSCFLCIDCTVLCLHSFGRVDEQQQPQQLLDKTVLERLKIDHDSIQMLMFRNSFKLTDCTASGLYQFIYDLNFLSIIYSKLASDIQPQEGKQKLVINTDSLLERLISIYAKDKNIKVEGIKFKRDIFEKALEKFLEEEYQEQKKIIAESKKE